jgi:tetratricopeptide (TPR) repeat protein
MTQDNPVPTSAGPRAGRGRRRAVFISLSIVLGTLPLVVLEATLRCLDIGRPQSYTDPFVGFSRLHGLFELDDSKSTYHTSHSQLHFFGRQSFPAQKPKESFRVFCLGGSTVLGHPFRPPTAFPAWLEVELEGIDPSRPVEAINCGGMSYASYRLVPILEEVLEYDPDLIIVLTGHNEFLESRTYGNLKARSATRAWIEEKVYSLHTLTLARQWADQARGQPTSRDLAGKSTLDSRVNARLDHATGYASYYRDDAWRQAVTEHYGFNLRRMVLRCRESGVPLVLIQPGCNLRDCPPFKSLHREGLTTPEEHRWQTLFDTAERIETTDAKKALDHYQEAAALDGEHALLSYRMARCFDRLDQIDEARTFYELARQQDVCPLRILPGLLETLSAVASESSTPIIDADALLGGDSTTETHGIPGNEHYVDHVHPGVRGHQIIAEAIAERLVDLGVARKTADRDARQRRQAYARELESLPSLYYARGRARVENLNRWARRDPLLPDLQPVDLRGKLALVRGKLEFGETESARAGLAGLLGRTPGQGRPQIESLLAMAREFFKSGSTQRARLLLEVGRDHGAENERLEVGRVLDGLARQEVWPSD